MYSGARTRGSAGFDPLYSASRDPRSLFYLGQERLTAGDAFVRLLISLCTE